LWQLVSGNLPLKALGGPISIASVAKDAAKMGWKVFLFAMALISINLAIVNMVPLPALDGGHLALLSFEAIRGRSLSVKGYENFQKIGFAVIISLFVVVFSNDLSRYWADIVGAVIGK
jgi:regulator of sigma E protease